MPSAHNQLRWRNELVRRKHPETDALDASGLPFPGPGAAAASDLAQVKMLAKAYAGGPMAKLKAAKEGMKIAKQVLKDGKLRWKIIWKAIVVTGGWTLLILVLLSPLLLIAWVMFAWMMEFRVSGKEWVLLLGSVAVLTIFLLLVTVQISFIVCTLDIECVAEIGIAILL